MIYPGSVFETSKHYYEFKNFREIKEPIPLTKFIMLNLILVQLR